MAASIPRRPGSSGPLLSGEAAAPRGSRLAGAAAPRGLRARARPELRRPGLGRRGGGRPGLGAEPLANFRVVSSGRGRASSPGGGLPRSWDSAWGRGAPSPTADPQAAGVPVQAPLPPAGAGGKLCRLSASGTGPCAAQLAQCVQPSGRCGEAGGAVSRPASGRYPSLPRSWSGRVEGGPGGRWPHPCQSTRRPRLPARLSAFRPRPARLALYRQSRRLL